MKINYLMLLFCMYALSSCYDINEHMEARRDAVVKLRPEFSPSRVVTANGADLMTIKMKFPQRPEMDCTLIKFTASEGVFLENGKSEFSSNELSQDDDGLYMVVARLKSSTNRGNYQLAVEFPAQSFKVSLPISFVDSYADSIWTDKNKFGVEASVSDEIQLIAFLKARKGLPHKGTDVEFVVADSISSKRSKWFRALTKTDAEGKASVFFSPGSLGSWKGPVKYIVSARGSDGNVVVANGVFDILPTKP